MAAPVLTGYKCDHCQQIYLQPSGMCSTCGAAAPLAEFDLPGDGSIVTFTTVWRGAPYLEQPYTLAIISLGDRIQVLGRVKASQSVAVAQKVRYTGKDEHGLLFELS